MCYIGVTEGKIEKEGKMRISIFIFIYTIHLAYLKVYTKFEEPRDLRQKTKLKKHWLQWEPRDLRQKFPLERKKNKQIKGLISNMWLFFFTQYNSSLSSFVPNLRILTQIVAEKSLTEKMSLCII